MEAPETEKTARRMSKAAKARLGACARWAFLVAGLVTIGVLVRDVGASTLAAILERAALCLPFVMALEVCRIGADALTTYTALGASARLVPLRMLGRAAFIARAVSSIAPAGRTAAEATKATLLAPFAGASLATSAAATGQSVTLVSVGIVSVPCAIAAWTLSGVSAVTLLLVAHAVLLVSTGVFLRVAMRSSVLGRLVFRVSRTAGASVSAFQAHARESRLLPPGPLFAALVGRTLQIAQYALLARAVGASPGFGRALVAEGANMVSLAVGALVPGQVGVSEGAFVWSADAIGATSAQAISIALLAHTLDLVFVPVGALVPFLVRASVHAGSSERSPS